MLAGIDSRVFDAKIQQFIGAGEFSHEVETIGLDWRLS
jgi:hypothetical protein